MQIKLDIHKLLSVFEPFDSILLRGDLVDEVHGYIK